MPITGRPSKTSGVNPWLRIHDRWVIPARPLAPNHVALRLPPLIVMVLCVVHRGVRGNTRCLVRSAARAPDTFAGVAGDERARWLVLVVRVPAEPSRHRVAVWREL